MSFVGVHTIYCASKNYPPRATHVFFVCDTESYLHTGVVAVNVPHTLLINCIMDTSDLYTRYYYYCTYCCLFVTRSTRSLQVFKSDVGPDGNARDELDVACSVDHPNVTKALGVVRAASGRGVASGERSGPGTTAAVPVPDVGGSINTRQWLVMERVAGQPLAGKPDFSSVLRCRWGAGRRFEPVLVLAVLLQVTVVSTCALLGDVVWCVI